MFIVECDFDFVCDCFFWSVGDETLATAEDLDGIGDVAVVDGDLKLALSGAGRVNSENGNWKLSMNLWHGFRNKNTLVATAVNQFRKYVF